MNKYLEKFRKYPSIADQIEKSIIEHEDVPDLVFMDIGRFIGENVEKISATQVREIFILIENGVSSEDEIVSTVMATHLLEAFYNALCRIDRSSNYARYVGGKSREYIEAYFLTPWGGIKC
ncbi:hypothetical protein [Asaia astilbis]|uniref:hypothetical protein n=1 Tax=Asaia astilbis TaxID=610244 RepID=UPI00046FFBDB|nr:hypothetical protein [Asaia astilbis]